MLYLDGEGQAAWSHDCTITPYIELPQSDTSRSSAIKITIQGRYWFCPATSEVGQRLTRQEQLSFKHFGKQLAVFELSVLPSFSDFFSTDESDDDKNSLKVEQVSPGIWYISGPRIYQIIGDEHALVVHTMRYLRLYDMDRKTMQWEKFEPKSRVSPRDEIFCLINEFVVMKHGSYHLLRRSDGVTYGKFDMPRLGRLVTREEDCCGPFVSSEGLVLFRPSAKFIYIFCVGKKNVKFRVWESPERVQGSFVLRGSLESLQWRLVDREILMKEHAKVVEKVYRTTFVDRWVERI